MLGGRVGVANVRQQTPRQMARTGRASTFDSSPDHTQAPAHNRSRKEATGAIGQAAKPGRGETSQNRRHTPQHGISAVLESCSYAPGLLAKANSFSDGMTKTQRYSWFEATINPPNSTLKQRWGDCGQAQHRFTVPKLRFGHHHPNTLIPLASSSSGSTSSLLGTLPSPAILGAQLKVVLLFQKQGSHAYARRGAWLFYFLNYCPT